jgi:hypothetical protein
MDKIRYYLHGDQHENKPGKYYCASCDFSFERSHFHQHDKNPSDMNSYEKYLQTLKSWKVIKKRSPQYYRLTNAVNLFE